MTREAIRTALLTGGAAADYVAVVCTLYGEVRGEPIAGMAAAALTIKNRVDLDIGADGKPDWWGEGYAGVCLAKWQFSCWWETGSNSDAVYGLAERLLNGTAMVTPNLAALQTVATLVMAGFVKDVTNGATHYLTETLLRESPPNWVQGRSPLAQLGDHVFFRA